MRIGNVPMKRVQLVIRHSVHQFLHGLDRHEIPGRVQHEPSICKERSVNDSTSGNDLNRITLIIIGNELTERFKPMPSTEEGVTSDFGCHGISLGLNVNSVALRRFERESFFRVIDRDL